MIITSLENEKIKNIIKLQRKKYRDLTNTYLIEGEHLVKEAYKEGIILELFLLEEEKNLYNLPCTYVSKDIMKKISLMDTPSNIVALCQKKKYEKIIGNRILLLDEIQDPGNLGTIIRSSLAFDVSMIILSEDTVDLYNPKVLRATQGMYCHIPIIRMDTKVAIAKLKKDNFIIYGTNVVNGIDISTLKDKDKDKWCLIMGNEGNGLKKEIQALCDKNLYIPMHNSVESLNVGVACSILLYEFRR